MLEQSVLEQLFFGSEISLREGGRRLRSGAFVFSARSLLSPIRLNFSLREDEDNAMWIDDGSGGRASAAPKKPGPKKDTKKAPKKGGFKFPWEN